MIYTKLSKMKKYTHTRYFFALIAMALTFAQFIIGIPSVDAQANRTCSSSTDSNCLQSDGRYRCWNGSTIAVGPGQSCPANPNDTGSDDTENLCEITGGQWISGTSGTAGTCMCPGGGVFALTTGCPTISLTQQQRQAACEGSEGNWSATTATCSCPEAGRPTASGACPDAECADDELTSDNCTIVSYLVNGINFLSAVAGMAIVASIMIAGYQYMTARDNPGQVEAAKKRILWAMVALGIFIFMYALLNFLVPGGVL